MTNTPIKSAPPTLDAAHETPNTPEALAALRLAVAASWAPELLAWAPCKRALAGIARAVRRQCSITQPIEPIALPALLGITIRSMDARDDLDRGYESTFGDVVLVVRGSEDTQADLDALAVRGTALCLVEKLRPSLWRIIRTSNVARVAVADRLVAMICRGEA